MFAQPSTEAFKPTTRPPDTADPDVGGLVGGDGGLAEIDGEAGAGAGAGETGADGVCTGRPVGDCAAAVGFPV